MPVALVTGAAKRIGRHLALAMAGEGHDVAVHYGGSKDEAEEAVALIGAQGRKAAAFQADLADVAALDAMMAAINRTLGPVDCLINSASAFEYDTHDDWTVDRFDWLQAVNLRAPLYLAQRMMHDLPKDRTALVVNLLDQKLFNLNPDFFSYTISKMGLKEATPLLAQAMAPRCRVNGIAPGLTLRSGDQTDREFAAVHDKMPLGRGTNPDDIADALRYLLHADAVTGTIIPVDCGQRLESMDRDIMFMDTESDS
ncbi:MAG: SDR family oxidoreductase [Alphaproteobacteria bacterium]